MQPTYNKVTKISVCLSLQVTCCRAAKKFRDLWALTRNVQDGAYTGVPQKPMNRVVMVLLGVLADESAAMERTELRAIAYAWFIDCARHNDLHRILQVSAARALRVFAECTRQSSKGISEKNAELL